MIDQKAIFWEDESFCFIEQTLLPDEEKIVKISDFRIAVDAIKRLAIRGAPAIGVTGAYALVLAWKEFSNDLSGWTKAVSEIREARPTAVNLAWAVDRMIDATSNYPLAEKGKYLLAEADRIAIEDAEMCEAMAEHGLAIIPNGSNALTHCNTGLLVSYGIGTSFGVLRRAHEKGLLKSVYACEARPLGQGSRLTMWELDKFNIPGTLLCDSAVGRLMQDGKIDFVMLGADRIASNGDTANKIGTFNLAVLAKHFKIPFYVVAPSSTVDTGIKSGEEIPVEYRSPEEVRECRGRRVTIKNAEAYNPAFDITPSELITAIIREDGVFKKPFNF